eukprot:gene17013-19462_t
MGRTKSDKRQKLNNSEFAKGTLQLITNFTVPRKTTDEITVGSSIIGSKRKISEVEFVVIHENEEELEALKEIDESLDNETKLKVRRNSYSEKQKYFAIDIYKRILAMKKFLPKEAVYYIRKLKGYEKVTQKMINHWQIIKVNKKRGPKVYREFETKVLDELIVFQVLSESVEILANGCFTYESIRSAAIRVQSQPDFQNNQKVQALKFSDGWIQKFLQRQNMRRRACTTFDKVKPKPSEVQDWLQTLQGFIESEGIENDCIFNEDETAIRWRPALLHRYVPLNAARASSPEGDDSGRFTALLGSSGKGKFIPPMFVIKYGIQEMLKLFKTEFVKDSFVESLSRCFARVGLTRKSTDPNSTMKWEKYNPFLRNGSFPHIKKEDVTSVAGLMLVFDVRASGNEVSLEMSEMTEPNDLNPSLEELEEYLNEKACSDSDSDSDSESDAEAGRAEGAKAVGAAWRSEAEQPPSGVRRAPPRTAGGAVRAHR